MAGPKHPIKLEGIGQYELTFAVEFFCRALRGAFCGAQPRKL